MSFDWLDALADALDAGRAAALVTVIEAEGSTPREVGARMAVTTDRIAGTVGGGRLELLAIKRARRLLADPDAPGALIERLALGPSLGQCCGGAARILVQRIAAADAGWIAEARAQADRHRPFVIATTLADAPKTTIIDEDAPGAPEAARAMLAPEPAAGAVLIEARDGAPAMVFSRAAPSDFVIFLFGAGHVGRAIARVLEGVPCRLVWIDDREGVFPAHTARNVETVFAAEPARLVAHAPPGAWFLVMTHSHALDFAICERVLARGDFAYLGLIGSKTKRARLARRMAEAGHGPEIMRGLTCPIGIDGIPGKTPGEIAIAVAAELLTLRAAPAASAPAVGAPAVGNPGASAPAAGARSA